MKRIILILAFLPFLLSCDKQEGPTIEATFSLNVSGFQITSSDFGELKASTAFEDFVHVYPSGTLTFTNSSGVVYNFNTGSVSIDEFSITLPTDTYTLTGSGGTPEQFGDPAMALEIEEQQIIVEAATTELAVTVTPTCALFLVLDENSLVDKASINGDNRPFSTQGTLYYIYFRPYSSAIASIFKTDGAILSIPTAGLQLGYIYKITVTASGTTQTLQLNPSFTETDPIAW